MIYFLLWLGMPIYLLQSCLFAFYIIILYIFFIIHILLWTNNVQTLRSEPNHDIKITISNTHGYKSHLIGNKRRHADFCMK